MLDWLMIVRRQKGYALAVFIAVLQGISAVALLASSAWLISRAAQQPPVLYLSIAVVGVRAFAIGRAFFRYLERLVSHDSVFRGLGRLRTQLVEKITPFIPAAIRSNSERLTNLVIDTEKLQDGPLRVVTPILVSAVTSILSILLIAWRSLELAIIFAILLLLGHALIFMMARLTRRSDTAFDEASQEVQIKLFQHLSFYRLNRDFDTQANSLAGLDAAFTRQGNLAGKIALLSGAAAALVQLWLLAAIVSISVLISDLLARDAISAVEVAVFILLPLAFADLLAAMVPGLALGRSVTKAASRVKEILNAEVPNQLQIRSGSDQLSKFECLRLAAVAVSYPNAPTVIDDFSLQLNAGESLFITGASGSGKSSIAFVLTGLVQPDAGKYLINGIEFSSLTRQSQVGAVGLIEQAPHIFPESLRVNLKLAKPDASDDEMLAALSAVGLNFDDRGGLDLALGEGAAFVSGGEAHRIALARAILANTSVLILDEPSANLDYQRARDVIDLYLATWAGQNRALIVISHDLTLADKFQRVIRLDTRN